MMRIWIVVQVVALALLVVGCGQQVGTGHHGDQASSGAEPKRTVGEEASIQTNCGPDAPTVVIGVDTSLNAADERRLVAVSDNVFLGRVLGKIRNVPLSENSPPLPTTEFAVKVEKNIKGSISGKVTVVQGGGCDPRYGRIALINNDPLLKPGERAVFSTTKAKDSPEGPYSLVSHQFSHVTVETEEQEARVVAKFREAMDRGNDQ